MQIFESHAHESILATGICVYAGAVYLSFIRPHASLNHRKSLGYFRINQPIIPVQYIVRCWFYVPRYWALSFDRITTINPPLRAARTAYRIRRDIPAHRAATAFLVDPGIRLSQPSPVRCPENPGISERSQDPNNVEQPLWANRWYGMERVKHYV